MKNKLALFLLMNAFITLSLSVSAQTINREVGVRMSGLENFNFIYKRGKKENRFTRVRFGAANFSLQGNDRFTRLSANVGIAVGREKRTPINDQFYFIHGWEPSLNIGISVLDEPFILGIQPAIGYVLGFQLDLLDNFYINIETIPRIATDLRITDSGLNNTYNVAADFSTNALALSLVYKFKK